MRPRIGSRAGQRCDRAGVAPDSARRVIARRCRPRRSISPDGTAQSSSSPICRRTAGTPAIAPSVPEGTTIEVADVGAMPTNLAVTAVRPLADRDRRHRSQRRPTRARCARAPDDRQASGRRRDGLAGREPVRRSDVCRRAARRGGGGDGRGSRRDSGGQRALRGAWRHRQAAGARRHRPRATRIATRSTCSTRWPPAPPPMPRSRSRASRRRSSRRGPRIG